MQPLTDLSPGRTSIVSELRFGNADVLRVMEMGFIPGASVACQRRVPLGDLAVYQVDGVQVALRRETASRILVQPASDRGGP